MSNRVIKESIKRSSQIDSLTWFEEVVFYRLIVSADDYGCYDGRTIVIRNELFPTKESITTKSISDAIDNLVKVGLLCKYTVSDTPYLFFPSWEKHQRVRNKRRKYPAPPDEKDLTATRCQLTASCQPESNPNPIRIQSESDTNPARSRDPAVAAVMSAYMDKINPTPSKTSIDELIGYVEEMGAECCLRAFDIALDAKKANWPYIRGILRSKLSQGVKCLSDWDALEESRESKRKETTAPAQSLKRTRTQYLSGSAGQGELGDLEQEALSRMLNGRELWEEHRRKEETSC